MEARAAGCLRHVHGATVRARRGCGPRSGGPDLARCLAMRQAAEIHGMLDKPTAKIHITVPHRRRPAQKRPIRGVVIHGSEQSQPQCLPPWVLPRTRIEDTVLDLVMTARGFDDAYNWVARATSRSWRVRTHCVPRWRNAVGSGGGRGWQTHSQTQETVSSLRLSFGTSGMWKERTGYPRHSTSRAGRSSARSITKTIGIRSFGVCVEIDGPAYHQNEQVGRDNRPTTSICRGRHEDVPIRPG